MSHKTLISGTAYEVSGGKTLIDSTVYEIDKGKTLVGGTAYEVGFAPATAILTLNTSTTKMTAVIIDGTEYSTTTTLEVPIGTVVTCKVEHDSSSGQDCYITINNSRVYTGGEYSYEYIVTGNASITTYSARNSDRDYYGYIAITEE